MRKCCILQKKEKEALLYSSISGESDKNKLLRLIFCRKVSSVLLTFGDSGINEISVNKSSHDQSGDFTDDDDKSKYGDCAVTMTNEIKLKALHRSLP